MLIFDTERTSEKRSQLISPLRGDMKWFYFGRKKNLKPTGCRVKNSEQTVGLKNQKLREKNPFKQGIRNY